MATLVVNPEEYRIRFPIFFQWNEEAAPTRFDDLNAFAQTIESCDFTDGDHVVTDLKGRPARCLLYQGELQLLQAVPEDWLPTTSLYRLEDASLACVEEFDEGAVARALVFGPGWEPESADAAFRQVIDARPWRKSRAAISEADALPHSWDTSGTLRMTDRLEALGAAQEAFHALWCRVLDARLPGRR